MNHASAKPGGLYIRARVLTLVHPPREQDFIYSRHWTFKKTQSSANKSPQLTSNKTSAKPGGLYMRARVLTLVNLVHNLFKLIHHLLTLF